ncbi:unnamed protein product [Xylocopa violacea]|uniref:Uncharacterized protein n=1 Tax=Xylocopa violacea TaxID=135666 RepID=A0ABP1NSC1_XYLVO
MFCARLTRQLKLLRVRQLHSTLIKNEEKPISETNKTRKYTDSELKHSILGSPLHTVSNLDKRILVWVKRYPSMDKVPAQVSFDCIHRAHTQVRIRICFMIMGFAIIGFFVSSRIGKRDAAAGKHIITERMKWYEELKEKTRKEAENAKAE